MDREDVPFLSLVELSQLIKTGEVSPVEVLEAVLQRIEEMEGSINAYITLCREEARQAALEAEQSIQGGNYLGPLHGIPIGLKDNIATRGIRTTCGSKVFANQVPDYDATVVERLKAAGAVIIGKHCCYEFALASPNPLYGLTHNPWNTEQDPGGSSSGTGAAIAAYMCHGGIGTDTGGSIRLPASMCGIVGFKQTYGRVSRHGVFPVSWSLDHAGPMARTVEDTASILQVIAGHDLKDPTTVDIPVPDYSLALSGEVRGLRAGIPRNYSFDTVEPETQAAVRRAIGVLEGAGMALEEVTLPYADYFIAALWVYISADAAAIHEPYLRTQGEDYTQPVLDMVGPGHFLPIGIYLKAEKARSLITQGMNQVLRQVDVLLTPTSPVVGWKVGGMRDLGKTAADLGRALNHWPGPFNLTGHPSISVPCGLNSEGLPIGFQITGRSFDEKTVLRVAHAYESLSPPPRL